MIATKRCPLSFYTPEQQVKYVGWLLSAYSERNVNKGELLLPKLADDGARAEAIAWSIMLINEQDGEV